MREIKFRAWDKYRNRLINDVLTVRFHRITNDPCLVVYTDKKIKNNSEIKESDKEYCNEFNLMQYTGLKDKNGKEIYEGDIIEFNNNDYARTAGHLDDEIIIAEVEYYCGHYGLKEANGQLHDLYIAIVNDDEAEIIGNIYENPELLEEKQ